MNKPDKKELIERLLTRGVERIYPSREFVEKLLSGDEQLSVYLGVDPTSPSLHLGHAIPLMKLRDFQRLGHRVILLIGDFTATIGDPTDKAATRVALSREQVLENARLYKEQAAKIISFEGENPAELKYNSEWLAKLGFEDVVKLAEHATVQQMMERDMFERRMEEGRPVYMQEFLYPLMQGYDSVVMGVDGEVGGNDQTFNMLMGRTLSKQIAGKEKFVITTKLLTDTEGAKMGKTTGTMVSVSDAPEEMFGKIMSWSDAMIVPGFELCTSVSEEEIGAVRKAIEEGENPIEKKKLLAHTLVSFYYDQDAADRAAEFFARTVQHKEIPDDIKEVSVRKGESISDVLVREGIVKSKSDFHRLVGEGAVTIHTDGSEMAISDSHIVADRDGILKIGKRRFLRIKIS